ncbi:hypothetical protein M413DRAFT_21981 [Hebeloma cylindrosporum]|uniref:Uncharacterized protein n=1 Tax=Hebeloma cylindrosporum TaxID=76867 RepID=A0A0C2YJA0_HEBCY|nr:hypothetical protein M413DRAFT_21981 [Hebeloma cylindrosporum h7]
MQVISVPSMKEPEAASLPTADLLHIKAGLSLEVETRTALRFVLPANNPNPQEYLGPANTKKMCRYRRVCNTYLCGHREQLPDELVREINSNANQRLKAF